MILYFTSAVDYAFVAAISLAGIVFNITSLWLFLVAFFSFCLFLLLGFLGLGLEFIGDLSISAYGLFVVGLVLYFLQGQKSRWGISFTGKSKIFIHRDNLLKFGGMLILVFMAYPLLGMYLALIAGYLAIAFAFKRVSDGRIAFGVAMFFLALCPFLLLLKQEKPADTAAIFAYYFLATAVIQEIAGLIAHRLRGDGYSPGEDDDIEIGPFIKKPVHSPFRFEEIVTGGT